MNGVIGVVEVVVHTLVEVEMDKSLYCVLELQLAVVVEEEAEHTLLAVVVVVVVHNLDLAIYNV